MAETHLVVTAAFGDHAAGDWLSDPEQIARALEDHADSVVRAAADANPAAPPPDPLTAAPVVAPTEHKEG